MSDQHDGPNDHPDHSGQEADGELGYYARRAQAREALLVEKGICTRDEAQRQVDGREANPRAAGRGELYPGVGPAAGRLAGRQDAEGRLYYFFLRHNRVLEWVRKMRAPTQQSPK